ncbi:hypothetical protein V8F20_002795 [Naviculisporaceae sp. PSN 640]
MAPEIRLFTTILSFVKTMLMWDYASESTHDRDYLSPQEDIPPAPRTRSRARHRNHSSASRHASSSSRGKRKKHSNMDDLVREFGPRAAGFHADVFSAPTQEKQEPPAAPPPIPSKVPIPVPNPTAAPAPDNSARRKSIFGFGLGRNSGSEKRGSHSSIPMTTGDGKRDPADKAIAGQQEFDRDLATQSRQNTPRLSLHLPSQDSDWLMVDHCAPHPQSKLTYAQSVQMSSQSQDEAKPRHRSRSRLREGEQANKRDTEPRERDLQEIESLRKQLSEATGHAKQAERASEELRYQLQNWANKCKTEHIPKGAGPADDTLEGTVDQLRRENHRLNSDLDEIKCHVFSLQSCRKDPTPREVGTQFDDLMSNVTDWVTRFVDRVQDSPARVEELLVMARKKPSDFAPLRKHIGAHPDLSNGSLFPQTDIDIFIAVVTRFLKDNIFEKVLSGIVPKYVDVISSIESSMQTNVEPKRDLYAIRSWRAETLNAVICGAEYKHRRIGHAKQLTVELLTIFKPFAPSGRSERFKFFDSCLDNIILPAIALQETFSTSTHHFYLDLDPYMIFNTRQEVQIGSDFNENLSKIKFENILQNRKTLVLAKVQPAPTRDELCQNLVNVATIAPALYMRKVIKADSLSEPTVVRPQHMVVAWGSQQEREKYLENQPTLITQIYSATAKHADEAGAWAKLPWN